MQVVANELTKQYRGRTVLDRVSLTAEPGTVTVVAGPNGSGKSTLFKRMTQIVGGGGDTTFGGRSWRTLDVPQRHVGVYLGAFPFHHGVRLRDHLSLAAASCGAPKSRSDEVLEQFRLEEIANRRVAELSMGQRQRLGIAAATIGEPPVLLLDEPFSALDPAEADLIYQWLVAIAQGGRTVIVSTHHLTAIEPFATHALILVRGRLAAAGNLDDLRSRHAGRHRYRVATAHPLELAARLVAAEFDARPSAPDAVDVRATSVEASRLAEVLETSAGTPRVVPVSLEDVYQECR